MVTVPATTCAPVGFASGGGAYDAANNAATAPAMVPACLDRILHGLVHRTPQLPGGPRLATRFNQSRRHALQRPELHVHSEPRAAAILVFRGARTSSSTAHTGAAPVVARRVGSRRAPCNGALQRESPRRRPEPAEPTPLRVICSVLDSGADWRCTGRRRNRRSRRRSLSTRPHSAPPGRHESLVDEGLRRRISTHGMRAAQQEARRIVQRRGRPLSGHADKHAHPLGDRIEPVGEKRRRASRCPAYCARSCDVRVPATARF